MTIVVKFCMSLHYVSFLHLHAHYTRLQNSEFSPHAELVVRAVREEGGRQGLLEFQRRWRQHFLDTMNPRFLPELWSVDHNPHQL